MDPKGPPSVSVLASSTGSASPAGKAEAMAIRSPTDASTELRRTTSCRPGVRGTTARMMKRLVGCGPLPAFPLPVPRAYEFPLPPASALQPAAPERRLRTEGDELPPPSPSASVPPAIPTDSYASRLRPEAASILGVAPAGTGAASALASLGAPSPYQATQLLAAGIEVRGALIARGTLVDQWVAANVAYGRALAQANAAERGSEFENRRARQSRDGAKRTTELAAEVDRQGDTASARALRERAAKETAQANIAAMMSRQRALIASIAKHEVKAQDTRIGGLAAKLSGGDPTQWAAAGAAAAAAPKGEAGATRP